MRVHGSRVQWAIAGIACGLFAAVSWSAVFNVHGPIVVVVIAAVPVFLAWKFMQVSDRYRRR